MAYQRHLYNHVGEMGKFVSLILKTKNIPFEKSEPPEGIRTDRPVLDDRGIIISGIYAIIEYLNEKYPEPVICLSEPQHKAFVRMFVDDVIRNGYSGNQQQKDEMLHVLKPLLKPDSFLINEKLTLLDLAVIPIITQESPEPWKEFKKHVIAEIN